MSNTSNSIEKTVVLQDTGNITKSLLEFYAKINNRYDCYGLVSESTLLEPNIINGTLLNLKNEEVRLRQITEITKHNISSCKHVMKITELRHMDGVKGKIELSDTELIVTTRIEKETPQVIHSNVKQLVEQQQSIFEMLWKKAIPAEQKIKEIEYGIKPPETKVLEDPAEIFNHMKYVIENASKRLICSPSGAMQMVYDNFFDLYKKILDKHRNGEGQGIRWLTVIDKENKDLIEVFINAGAQVRHVSNLPPINFAVDNINFHATIEKMEGGKIMESLLSSNEPKYVNYYTSLFEGLWNNGIDAETRIKDIEEGTDSANIEIIQNSHEALKRSSNLVRNANEEALFMFSTPNALRRQLQVQSLLQFDETTREHPFVKIKILVPSDGQIKETIEELRVEYPQVDFRIYEQGLNSRITIVLVDKRECMIIEVKDDTKDDSYKAVGLSVYSNSKSIVLSYVSIFESLWRQTELYEQLKIHDKMQKEFINITAHELRTPVQSLLVLTEVLYSEFKDIEEHRLLHSTIKSAKRLQRLSNDILDVTRIESQSLELNTQQFKLNDVILDVMTDMKNQIGNNKVKLSAYQSTQDIFVKADKERITQVISNLLNNAIKFTEEGRDLYSLVQKLKITDTFSLP
ncbi:MAG TPA: HAMP domain-containing sensor histidine kinase [Candidatus Bathyarchaeia archaeon]|nr:HAMP domain-containing sensor histidine kinase [Candidatus Bathyarchaeia archaeon]